MSFWNVFKRRRSLIWRGNILVDAETGEILAQYNDVSIPTGEKGARYPIYRYREWDGFWDETFCRKAFSEESDVKRFLEKEFRYA